MSDSNHVWSDVRASIAEQDFRKLGDILLALRGAYIAIKRSCSGDWIAPKR